MAVLKDGWALSCAIVEAARVCEHPTDWFVKKFIGKIGGSAFVCIGEAETAAS